MVAMSIDAHRDRLGAARIVGPIRPDFYAVAFRQLLPAAASTRVTCISRRLQIFQKACLSDCLYCGVWFESRAWKPRPE